MVGERGRPRLHVEGIDDLHTIKHLLSRHGVDLPAREVVAHALPLIEPAGNVERLLKGMEASVEASALGAVAFVLDADTPMLNRWSAVRDRLRRVEVESPQRPPAEGFIGVSTKYQSTVGVWLMPDNQRDGTLEDFLQMLIAEGDGLIGYAKRTATHARRKKGARFPAARHDKAVIHTWLAWQETPGLPYGSAVAAHFFRHDSPAALAFVSWFKRLFGVA